MNALSYTPPTPIQLGHEYGFGLEREAMDILRGKREMPDGAYLKSRQVDCVVMGNEHALALWSRLRWMWVKNMGRAEVW